MKWILSLLLINNVSAATLSQYISNPEGSSEQRFELTKSSAQYVKKSNFFDNKKDYFIGTLNLQTLPTSDFKTLEELSERIEVVDNLLKKKKSSFNDLSDKAPHASFFLVDHFRVTQKSDLYPEVKALFEKLQAHDWKEVSGIRVSEDLKELIYIEKKAIKKKEPFKITYHCDKAEPPMFCLFKGFGNLHID